ncbi:protein of unknown function [Methylocaldum szegediense]|uniref:Uncharacterized protein n=1 Tax=Methylocaldum szegediense TaxID=73780 RepID=A0ABM9HXW8_9GAMM|nr:protein of unknown function [Methylocaldum szegediense]
MSETLTFFRPVTLITAMPHQLPHSLTPTPLPEGEGLIKLPSPFGRRVGDEGPACCRVLPAAGFRITASPYGGCRKSK